MKKLYVLVGMMALSSLITLNAMESRHQADQMIDAIIKKKWHGGSIEKIDWSAIFKIIDEMQGLINVNEYRYDGQTLLYIAVDTGKFLVAKTLLEKYKANPNKPYRDGSIPLMRACVRDDIPMVKLLLLYGADPDIKDKDGHDSFYYAAYYSGYYHTKIVEILNPYTKKFEKSPWYMKSLGELLQ